MFRGSMGLPPTKSETGRSKRDVPEKEVDEGDGVRAADKYRAKNPLIVLFLTLVLSWLYWMFDVISKSSGKVWGALAVIFIVWCGWWVYQKLNPPPEDEPKPRK